MAHTHTDSMAEQQPNQSPNVVTGQRWRIHPASDWFMRGITFASVTKVGTKWIHMKSYRHNGAEFKIRKNNFALHVYPQGFQP